MSRWTVHASLVNVSRLGTINGLNNFLLTGRTDGRTNTQTNHYRAAAFYGTLISVSQSNLLYPKYGVYVHNYLKRQKIPKRVEMHPSKWHQKKDNFFIYPFRSFKCNSFVENNSFCRELYRMGGILDYAPFWVQRHLDWTKLAQRTTRACILQNKNKHLRYILRIVLTKSPCGASWVRTGPKMHMHN